MKRTTNLLLTLAFAGTVNAKFAVFDAAQEQHALQQSGPGRFRSRPCPKSVTF
jgi:hypothetical protein